MVPDPDRRLAAFERLLADRGAALGVVGPGDRDRIWERHIADSLRAMDCLAEEVRTVADLGSGGGLPGIPLAIVRPDLRFALVEPRRRRAAFLELAVEQLSLSNVVVVASTHAEVRERFDVCLARALAGAARTWELARSLLNPRGYVVYFAGRTWGAEEVASLAAGGVHVEICSAPTVAWQGPLVMMIRPETDRSSGEPHGA